MNRSVALWRGIAISAACVLSALATGCAPIAPAPVSSATPPAAKSPASGPAVATPEGTRPATPARSDSLPSPDAQRVLASIPEPLGSSQQVPPDSTRRRSVVAPEAAYDTLRTAPGEEGTSGVPVPGPTPVAAAPVVTMAPPESTSRSTSAAPAPATSAPATSAPPASGAPAAGTAVAPAAGTAAATTSGPCWRVQVAAPATRAEADSRLAAAQSLLVVNMAIVPEKGLFKVRTADCLTREVAESLRQRAVDSGFDGSFLVDTAAPPKPATSTKKKATGKGSR